MANKVKTLPLRADDEAAHEQINTNKAENSATVMPPWKELQRHHGKARCQSKLRRIKLYIEYFDGRRASSWAIGTDGPHGINDASANEGVASESG